MEAQAENLSAYIPTNLISITDGQIYLSPGFVRENQLLAVDLRVSVSRLGGKDQHRSFREVTGNQRVPLSQFAELENLARFRTRLDDVSAGQAPHTKHGQEARRYWHATSCSWCHGA